jgi:hypothetical protein
MPRIRRERHENGRRARGAAAGRRRRAGFERVVRVRHAGLRPASPRAVFAGARLVERRAALGFAFVLLFGFARVAAPERAVFGFGFAVALL